MTKRDIFSVALKILGVVSIMRVVESVLVIGMGLATIFGEPKQIMDFYNPHWFLWTGIVSFILWLIMSYLLLRWGDLFAQKLIHDESIISLSDREQWEKPVFILSLKVIGVVCLVMGLPRLIDFFFDFAVRHWHQKSLTSSNINVNAIVLVIFGVYLISGGRHLVEFVYRGKTITPEKGS